MEANESKFNREEWVAKIQALLATADSYDKQGETLAAASYRAKAEQLMNKHRVEEEEMRLAQPIAMQLMPITHDVNIGSYARKYDQEYRDMMSSAVLHSGCRWAYSFRKGQLIAHITGFTIDVQYAELLFLNASVVFAAHLEPAYDPALSETENIYRLRRAGVTRRDIAVKLWGMEVDHSVPAHGKVQKIYEAECLRRGEAPLSGRGVSRAVYSELYAKSFVDRFQSRLYRARTDAGLNQAGEMVLSNRKERVTEAFYEMHPHLRPTEPSNEVAVKESASDRAKREAREDREGARREKQYIEAETRRNSPAGRAGRAAGYVAADKVALRATTGRGEVQGG